MAKYKNWTGITEVNIETSGEILIDSEMPHRFFHNQFLFQTFKASGPKQVFSALFSLKFLTLEKFAYLWMVQWRLQLIKL